VAGPDAAARWSTLPMTQRRAVVKALVDVRIHRTARGNQYTAFDPESVKVAPAVTRPVGWTGGSERALVVDGYSWSRLPGTDRVSDGVGALHGCNNPCAVRLHHVVAACR
jgi:hypothetical protein